MCLLLILSNKLDLNQETRFTITEIRIFRRVLFVLGKFIKNGLTNKYKISLKKLARD
jgi:hypothetical protein